MTQGAKKTLTDIIKIVTAIGAIITAIGCTITVIGVIASWGATITKQYLDIKKDLNTSTVVNAQQSEAIKTHEERLNRLETKVDADAQKILDNEYELTKIRYHVK